MKQLKTIISVMALLVAFSCTKSMQDGNGRVTFEVSGGNIVADVTKSNVSDYTPLPTSADFTITILDASSASVWTGKISEWDSSTPLLAGNYTVQASYGSLEDEGFDKPYFYGETAFAVTGGETVSVKVNVSLGNTIIKVTCSDYFTRYYKDYTFTLKRDNTDVVTFEKGETKAAFIDGYKITVAGIVTGELKAQTFEQSYTNLEAATAYTLHFDADNVGGSTITITFNDTVEEVALGDIELNE